MSTEQRKYIRKLPFYKKYVCPICEGRGAVECCNADGNDCVPVPCDFCDGKGVIKEKNIAGIIGSIVVIIAIIAAIIFFI